MHLYDSMWFDYVCRALVYISHGVTEYMGRYETLAQLLADSGLFVFGHDHGTNIVSVLCLTHYTDVTLIFDLKNVCICI